MIKQIISDIKAFIEWVKTYLFYRKHAIKLKLAIKLANIKQSAYNKQYFVILSSQNKLISINEKEINYLRSKKVYSHKQMKNITKRVLSKQDEEVRKLKYDLYNCRTGDERRETNSAIIDIQHQNRDLIQRLSKLTILPKHVDGMTIRKTAFYYTPYSANNTMSREQRHEAKARYLSYAKKYSLK